MSQQLEYLLALVLMAAGGSTDREGGRAGSVKTIGFLNTGTSQEELRWRSWLGFLDAMCRDLGLGSKKAALNESIFY